MKNIIGYTSITLVRAAMIGCIVKLTVLWQPVIAHVDLVAMISKNFV